MFGFLKDKLKKVISSVAEKIRGKSKQQKEPEKTEQQREAEKIGDFLEIEKAKEHIAIIERVEEEERKEKEKEAEGALTTEEREEIEKDVEDIIGGPSEKLAFKEEDIKKLEKKSKGKKQDKDIEKTELTLTTETLTAKEEQEEKEVEKELEEEKIEIKKEFEEEIKEEKVEKKGFFAKLKEKLTEKFQVKLDEKDFSEFFSELEIVLMENSVALDVIDALNKKLKKELVNKPMPKREFENAVKEALANSIDSLMIEPFDIIEEIKNAKKPYVIVFFGINGSGKTTTIAKFAHLLQKENLSCVLAASDTFRAASIEQLEKHGSKLGIKVIKHKYGADPAAVAFDAIAHAKSKAVDVVLVDTAGRMHTQANLMSEMEKIVRVAKPNLKIFIGESIVGNDAVEQAKSFNNSIGIDAIILSKADVDEKGGAAISVSYITGKPILFLGMGQDYDDLEKFNKHKIIKSLGLE